MYQSVCYHVTEKLFLYFNEDCRITGEFIRFYKIIKWIRNLFQTSTGAPIFLTKDSRKMVCSTKLGQEAQQFLIWTLWL